MPALLHGRCFDLILIRDKIPRVFLRRRLQIPYFEEMNRQLQKLFAAVTWRGRVWTRILRSCRASKKVLGGRYPRTLLFGP